MLAHIWTTAYPIIIAILFFELIITIHEAGHFVAARLMGVKVNEFAIGMGPKVFSFERGGTVYSIRWILIGGYCQMEGENEDSDADGSFSTKKVWQRIVVVIAGALMNLILGFVIVAIMISSQSLVGTTTIAKFEDNAVSANYLQKGDIIKSIEGMRVYTPTDVGTGLSRTPNQDEINMVINRDGKDMDISVRFDMEEFEGKQYVKMDFWLLGNKKTFSNVASGTFNEWLSYARMVFLSVHDLISGQYGLKDLSGPVGAVSVVSSAVKTSVFSMLKIMALLTINVGLFNLLPIPALDGWRFFLLVFEGIFRRKLPEKWEWMINAVGLALLLGLMCVVTFSDVTRLFG